MATKKRARPRDTNQLAKRIVDIATAADLISKKEEPSDEVKAAAAALGRLGGLKGGKARAAKLTAKRRKEIARKAARARWDKK
jgi:hypothetical protein